MSRITVTVVGVTAALLLTACSSSKASGGPSTGTTVPQVTITSPATVPTTSVPASTNDLSGKWTGKYSGAFDGTFTLNWQQSGSTLTGTIDLSTAGTSNINGTVNGGTISFGTVGSTAITYTGSVSGNSMSGTYKVKAGNTSTSGSWSATKTS